MNPDMETESRFHDLSDDVLLNILLRVEGSKYVSLVCRKWYEVDRGILQELSFDRRWIPAMRAVAAFSSRFFNLAKLTISYDEFSPSWTDQIDDDCLRILSLQCLNLSDLSLELCERITNLGIGIVARCRRLSAVRLEAMPRVDERGLLYLVRDCHSLRLLHLTAMDNLRTTEWLEFIGTHQQVEDLMVWNCLNTGESKLVKLGRRGWRNLHKFSFSFDTVFTRSLGSEIQFQDWEAQDAEDTAYCPNLEWLSLSYCPSMSETGLLWILAQCKSLREVNLSGCDGIRAEDIRLLAENNSQMSSLSLIFRGYSPEMNGTNVWLLNIANNCCSLKTLRLRFGEGGMVFPGISESGVVAIVERCRQLESLTLEHFVCVRERAMAAIGLSTSLQAVHFGSCTQLTDEMILLLSSRLSALTLIRCPLLTDNSLSRFSGLEYLSIKMCPRITRAAASHATRGYLEFSEL